MFVAQRLCWTKPKQPHLRCLQLPKLVLKKSSSGNSADSVQPKSERFLSSIGNCAHNRWSNHSSCLMAGHFDSCPTWLQTTSTRREFHFVRTPTLRKRLTQAKWQWRVFDFEARCFPSVKLSLYRLTFETAAYKRQKHFADRASPVLCEFTHSRPLRGKGKLRRILNQFCKVRFYAPTV